ncbi:MAG TPA: glycosyltransferase [Solirubrobacteraceae bacterium]|nr:glycosyltransferase [Solirubrobacteraceae bacterium]
MAIESGSVLLATPRWTRDGGVATHAIASAAALAERGVEVHALAARVEAEPIDGITVHHAPELFKAGLTPEQRLGEARHLRPAVVHLHQLDDPSLLTVLQRLAPVVASVHGYSACTSGVHYFRPGQECDRPHGPGCVPNLALRGCAHTRDPRWLPRGYRKATLSVQALRSADLAVSYSSAVDRHLAVNGVARRAIVPLFATTPPAVDAVTAEATANAGAAEAAGVTATAGAAGTIGAAGTAGAAANAGVTGTLAPTHRRVVFAGRVVTPKGVGILIRAVRRVDCELVICGDGWQLEAMRRLARRLGVHERVRFTGWLAAPELARELRQASVVAIPSLWPEPFGLVGIEAGAAARPVVASLTGGVGDWLKDGVNGLGVPPGDADALAQALNELLDDPERGRRFGEAGRGLVAARFTRERHVDALLDAYRKAHATWQSSRGGRAAADAPDTPRAEPSQV